MNPSKENKNALQVERSPRSALEHAMHREAHGCLFPMAMHSPEKGGHRARDEHRETHACVPSNEQVLALSPIVNDCGALYRDLRFDEGIARARRDAGWESDPEARLHVALGLHYKHLYDEARAEYEVAETLSSNASFRGTCVANVGITWYEEGDFERALATFERALEVDPLNEFGLVGGLAIAAERRDDGAVVAWAARIRERWPDWQRRTVFVHALTVDLSYRLLRRKPELFERAFGVSLDALRNG